MQSLDELNVVYVCKKCGSKLTMQDTRLLSEAGLFSNKTKEVPLHSADNCLACLPRVDISQYAWSAQEILEIEK